jgi:O-antigen/teichoic acid export membrane protein
VSSKFAGLLSIVKRNFGLFLVQISGIILGAMSQLLLGKFLGPEQYGIFVQAFGLLSIIGLTAALGFKTSGMRFIPEYLTKGKNSALASFILFTAGQVFLVGCMCSIIALVLYETGLIEIADISIAAFELTILAIPAHALMSAMTAMVRGFGYSVLAISIDRPLRELFSVIGGATIYYFGGGAATALGFTYSGILLGAAIGIVAVSRRFPKVRRDQLLYQITWIKRSIPMLTVTLSALLIRRADILLVGYFLGNTSAGIYGIAVMVADVVLVPLNTLGIVFGPIASKLYAEKKPEAVLVTHYRFSVATGTIATLAGIVAIIFAPFILSLVSEAYVDGAGAMRILLLFTIVRCWFGNSNLLLMMTDREKTASSLAIGLSVLSMLVNLAVIPRFGILGAAAVTGTIISLQAALFFYFGRRQLIAR